jgi:hypothetical protein
MNITIVGARNRGSALAKKPARAGHMAIARTWIQAA